MAGLAVAVSQPSLYWSAVLQHFTTPGHDDRLRGLTAPQFLRCETRSLTQRG
jgi:hypothetical protein